MTTRATINEEPSSDIIDRFKDFCSRRSKEAMSSKTLKRYGDVIDVLSRYHALPLGSVDLNELTRVITERTRRINKKKLFPATFNTEIAVLHRWCEFHNCDPTDKQFREVLRFKRLKPDNLNQDRRLKDSDVL